MGLLKFFRRKKEITPKEMKEMVENLKGQFEVMKATDDEEVRKVQAQYVLEKAHEVLKTIRETLEKVNKYLKETESSSWWATAEANSRDHAGLTRGKKSLLEYEQEIFAIISELSQMGITVEKEQQGPTNA